MSNRSRQLSNAERVDWLRLIRSENVGPSTFWQLLTRFGTAAAALDAIPELAKRGGMRRRIKICTKAQAETELAKADKLKARFMACGEADYPLSLAATDLPPPLLCFRGHAIVFKKPIIGIVGARNSSAGGNRLTKDMARKLGERGYTIVSGMARGIDTAAHKGSLATGTIAVMAGGVDHIYPRENDELFHQIVQSGIVLSELPIGVAPQARDFPRRNRIISGLSLGVVVVEASVKSGSLITAQFALEQGREVFAVPGFPLDPRSRGSNRLIQQGALLIQNADDVNNALSAMTPLKMEEAEKSVLPPELVLSEQLEEAEIDAARHTIEQLLSASPTSVDELIRQSGLPSHVVLAGLMELELAGRLERHAGGLVTLLYDVEAFREAD